MRIVFSSCAAGFLAQSAEFFYLPDIYRQPMVHSTIKENNENHMFFRIFLGFSFRVLKAGGCFRFVLAEKTSSLELLTHGQKTYGKAHQ